MMAGSTWPSSPCRRLRLSLGLKFLSSSWDKRLSTWKRPRKLDKWEDKGGSAERIIPKWSCLQLSSSWAIFSRELASIHCTFSSRRTTGFSWVNSWRMLAISSISSSSLERPKPAFSKATPSSFQLLPSWCWCANFASSLTKRKLRLDIKTNWRNKRFFPVPDWPKTRRGPEDSPTSTRDR